MRICILIHHIGPYHHARLKALSREHELFIIGYGRITGVAYEEVREVAGYQFVSVDCEGRSWKERIATELEKVKPEVLAIPGWSEGQALFGLNWALRNNLPTVVFSDSLKPGKERSFFKEWLKRRLVPLFSAAFVAGHSHREYISQLGMVKERVFLGYDVVDNDYFADKISSNNNRLEEIRREHCLPSRLFLTVCNLIPRKNVFGLIDSYVAGVSTQQNTSWGLLLVGDGPQKDAIQRYCREKGVADLIIACGSKGYDELPYYYNLADVFILASHFETWGLVVNEAMAAGLPVLVSSACGCAHELVEEGRNGFTFDPGRLDQLSALMSNIATGHYDLHVMGRYSMEVISRWTIATFVENFTSACQAAKEVGSLCPGFVNRLLLALLTTSRKA